MGWQCTFCNGEGVVFALHKTIKASPYAFACNCLRGSKDYLKKLPKWNEVTFGNSFVREEASKLFEKNKEEEKKRGIENPEVTMKTTAMAEKTSIDVPNPTYLLTKEDMREATKVAMHRREIGLKQQVVNMTPNRSEKEDNVYRIVGAVGEIAASKILGIKWEALTSVIGPDLSKNVQIRTIQHANRRLAFRPRFDDSSHIFVLMHFQAPCEVHFKGWAYGHEIEAGGRKFDGVGNAPDCLFMDNDELKSFSELKEVLVKQETSN